MIKLLIDFLPSQECSANIGLSVSLATSRVKGAGSELLSPYVLIKENRHTVGSRHGVGVRELFILGR